MEKSLVQRALTLLKEWGKCVYFDSSSSLSNIVVLGPQFLTQDVLAQLFNINPSLQDKRRNGIVNHKDLSSFWNKFASRSDFEQLCQNLIELMENFEVCFVLEEDKQKPFSEQRSLVLSLLPFFNPFSIRNILAKIYSI